MSRIVLSASETALQTDSLGLYSLAMVLGARLPSVLGSAISLLAVAACGDAASPERPSGVTAEASDAVHTVVKVRWTTDTPTIGYVEYGPTRALGSRTPLEDVETTEHALSLLGLHAETTYYYRVVTWDGRDAGASGLQRVVTGILPAGMPRFEVQGEGNDLFTLVPILGSTKAVLIIDRDGEIVWYRPAPPNLDVYRARLAVNGKDLLYNAASVSGDPADDSELVRVALDGSSESSIAVPLLAHDFVEHPDETLAAIVVEYRDFAGTPLRGEKIVEVDAAGNQTEIWNSWDCFDPAVETGDDMEHGWTFANALDYDPVEQVYYIGMRNFSSIAKVNRATGACEWVLGLTASTFDFAPGSELFLHQHQFHVRDGRILVFDNEGSSSRESRVLEYELDMQANLATQVWSFTSDPSVYSFVLGEPTRLSNGDTFISWATAGQLERVNAAGESLWKLNAGAGTAFAFNTLAPTLYPPTAP